MILFSINMIAAYSFSTMHCTDSLCWKQIKSFCDANCIANTKHGIYEKPKYGWPHQEANILYPADEKSFRATLNATSYTREFTVNINPEERKVYISFDPTRV